jgi:integrase
MERAKEVTERHGPNALLFPGPKGPTQPWTESEFRNVFLKAATHAGWEMVGPFVRSDRRACPGKAAIPYRNLRHHAAVWMREVARFDWADVSRALGHASVAFTHARYVRPGADADERNRRSLDSL